MATDETRAAALRDRLNAAHCVEQFDVSVVSASRADGEDAVILAVLPVGEKGWTFPLPLDEARRIAALIVEKADAKETKL